MKKKTKKTPGFDPGQLAMVAPVIKGAAPANIITMLDAQIREEEALALAAELAPLEAKAAELQEDLMRFAAKTQPANYWEKRSDEDEARILDFDRSLKSVYREIEDVRARHAAEGK